MNVLKKNENHKSVLSIVSEIKIKVTKLGLK